MGPSGRFDPVWGLMSMWAAAEVVVVALLVMPMPSNKLRGQLHQTISRAWHSQDYLKKTSWVLLTLNLFYLYDAASALLGHNKIMAASCESQAMAMYFQRNLLVTGGSVFLFFVMRRLLEIQGQLFTMRALAKEAAAAQQQLEGGPAASSGGLEAQRALTLKLSRLARSSEDGAAGPKDE